MLLRMYTNRFGAGTSESAIKFEAVRIPQQSHEATGQRVSIRQL